MKNVSEIRQKSEERTAPIPFLFQEAPDFSLVLGGPLFQLFRRSHLSGTGLELLYRRILLIPLVAWLPLLLLSLLGSHLLGTTVKLTFLRDIEAHVRLLVALPVLIAAELVVHARFRPVVKAFLARHIVFEQDVPRFLAAVDSARQESKRLTGSLIVNYPLFVFAPSFVSLLLVA